MGAISCRNEVKRKENAAARFAGEEGREHRCCCRNSDLVRPCSHRWPGCLPSLRGRLAAPPSSNRHLRRFAAATAISLGPVVLFFLGAGDLPQTPTLIPKFSSSSQSALPPPLVRSRLLVVRCLQLGPSSRSLSPPRWMVAGPRFQPSSLFLGGRRKEEDDQFLP
jgi:hypothetical protein